MATEPPEGPTAADATGLTGLTGPAAADAPAVTCGPGVTDARRRRRLDEVFGDVMPSVTVDELGIDEPVRDGQPGGFGAADEELRANRPPHYDRS